MGEWRSTPLCSKFKYTQDIDKFKGMCDTGMKGGVTSPAGCCQHCSLNTKCTSFVYVSGTCFLKNCAKSGGHVELKGAWSAWVEE